MRAAMLFMVCITVIVSAAGCGQADKCTVTQYGAEFMTYTGSRSRFDDACRQVLRDLSYKEETDENGTRYPYYGEGARTISDDDRSIAMRTYLKTKDDDGAEYEITTIFIGKREPVVILSSTSPEPYKLVNALNTEFSKRGIRVQPY